MIWNVTWATQPSVFLRYLKMLLERPVSCMILLIKGITGDERERETCTARSEKNNDKYVEPETGREIEHRTCTSSKGCYPAWIRCCIFWSIHWTWWSIGVCVCVWCAATCHHMSQTVIMSCLHMRAQHCLGPAGRFGHAVSNWQPGSKWCRMCRTHWRQINR